MASSRKTVVPVPIRPSHWDDDGYLIRWLRSAILANTLDCLNGLAEDAARRRRDEAIRGGGALHADRRVAAGRGAAAR